MNPQKRREAVNRWYHANKEKVMLQRKDQYHSDPEYRLAKLLRDRLRHAIKKGLRGGSAVRDLGCTVSELRAYLEVRFRPGMTWENWGKTGWHIDHIQPLAKFDLTDRQQFLQACHYTNLQPLWAEENYRKADNLPPDQT
jgi:hypothetical protein